MIAVDTNLLVYAHRREMTSHAAAREAIRRLAEGHSAWAVPWSCGHEFISVVTNPKPFKKPTSPRDAVAFILDQFPIVRQKDEQAHGRYRTRERILEIYDAMLEAQRTGRPYQTTLNPPPGEQ